jgi:hypothetical protein
MDELLAALAFLIALLLFGLALVIVIDRARIGYRRAEAEKSGRRQREHELSMRLEQLERAIAEQRPAIAGVERQLAKVREECDTLKRRLDSTEYPFAYTVVPLESRDMYSRSWRFSARHPSLGADLPEIEPAGQWNQGRLYAVAAENQAEARSLMDRLLPRHRGFVVVNVGEAPPEATAPSV